MDEKMFDQAVEKATENHFNELQDYNEPIETYLMSPMQAAYIEKELNATTHMNHLGFLLVPVRTSQQILYKSPMAQEQKTFAEEEESLLLEFYKNLESVKKTVSQEEFHCFLTLQQLRRHPLGRYFMSMPNPLYLKLYDYKKIVGDFLDIRTIANRVLRRAYNSKEEFEVDMVSMIHKYRTYFVFDKQMFDISIKFQILFWDIYKNQEKTNKDAMETFKYLKQRCRAARNYHRKEKEKYPFEKKKELIALLNSLDASTKNKVLFALQAGPLKSIKIEKNQSINLSKMKDQFFVELQEVLKEERKKANRDKIRRQRKRKERMQEGGNDDANDIFYSDQEDQGQNNRQTLQEVLDLINMEEAAFGSDDD